VTTTTSKPAFRRPWEHGAKAYHEADSFDAIREGTKRFRKSLMIHMPLSVAGDIPCGSCGINLDQPYELNPGEGDMRTDEAYATITYYPKTKRFTAAHYYCGWGALMQRVFDLGERIGY